MFEPKPRHEGYTRAMQEAAKADGLCYRPRPDWPGASTEPIGDADDSV